MSQLFEHEPGDQCPHCGSQMTRGEASKAFSESEDTHRAQESSLSSGGYESVEHEAAPWLKESPFLLPSGGVRTDGAESETAWEMGGLGETLERDESPEAHDWSMRAREEPRQELQETESSPQLANLTADEIATLLGRKSTLVALHWLLASNELQQAALAALLNKAGRRSVRVLGSNLPVPSYLRLVSRLCRGAAEQVEAETMTAEAPVLSETDTEALASRPAHEAEDLAAAEINTATLAGLQRELNSAAEQEVPPQCDYSKYYISGYSEYAVTPDKLEHEQRYVLSKIASEIVASFSTNKPIVAVYAVGHADVALRKPVAERRAFEQTISQQRAENVLRLIMDEVRKRAGAGWGDFISNIQTRVTGVGSTQLQVKNPTTESERRLNRRVT